MTGKKILKKFQPVKGDLQCEVKSIDAPFDYTDDMHNHFCHEILILLDGEIWLYTEFSGKVMHKGDVAFIPHYLFHTADIHTLNKYDRVVINVSDAVLKKASNKKFSLCSCFEPYDSEDKSLHSIHLSEEELEEIKKQCICLQKNIEHPKASSDILVDAYLKLIMVKLTSKHSDNPMEDTPNALPDIVSRTFEYIDAHLTEEITLSILEKEIHHNGTYISRCVKKFSGLTIQQYIIAKKIALACKLLQEGYSPSDACYMSGFNNYSNFSRTFSKRIGYSPKQLQMATRKIK
ncbi:AraC-type DNA-binding protein [Butyrivibrio proteoclasticus]|uniref:AraC-type DNA-binding protein n=1 Tax=Butyrivibrio proteoclasticus TaxID=43305 RepID=A0A1I5XJ38_9FIRM|nr:AraC family transcriptional regulator [Butyrivibrio proteoclasticus]SFQ31971.1 AraC-type DNA-binding protein [Butyrivibrio proteoclasticus]